MRKMNKIKSFMVFMILLFGSIEILYSQEKLNEFVIKQDSNCPITIRPGDGEYGFVVINTALSNLNFSIPNAPKRLVKADFKTERQQWILTIVPNDNNYKRYKITINRKGFKQGEIEVLVKQKESQCFDVDPLHENVTEVPSEEDRIHILPRVDVSYYEKGEMFNNRLYAKVEGIEYKIDIPNEEYDPDNDSYDFMYIECFSIVEQEDFDGNGIIDALIEENACGGNIGINVYFIVSYSENGYFSISNRVAGNSYSIEDWKGKISILVFDANVGYGNVEMGDKKERYVLKDGKLELVETLKKQLVVSVKELKSSDFHHEEEKPLRLAYDLDGNGITDYFECHYWFRWGSMSIYHFVLNGKEVDDAFFSTGIKRIGVLSTITNGYHDLVLDEDIIIKWNGKKYVFPD